MSGLEHAFIGDRISAIHTAATKLGVSLASYHWDYDAVQDMDAELDELFGDDGETRMTCLTDPIEAHAKRWYGELESWMTGEYGQNTKSLIRDVYKWMRHIYHEADDEWIGVPVSFCIDSPCQKIYKLYQGVVVFSKQDEWTGRWSYKVHSPSFFADYPIYKSTCVWFARGELTRSGVHPSREEVISDRVYDTFTPDQVEGEGA